MFNSLTVCLSIAIREGCPISYDVGGSGETEFVCGTRRDGVELHFEAEALREFLRLGGAALQEMDEQFAREEAEQS